MLGGRLQLPDQAGLEGRFDPFLALDTDASVFENTIFSAACQMPVYSWNKRGWTVVWAVSQ
jgi:hypothetical protein